MNSQDIKELFALQNVLAQVTGSVDADIVTEPSILAALIDWKKTGDNSNGANTQAPKAAAPDPEPEAAPVARTRTKRPAAGRAAATDDSDSDF